MKFFLYFIAGVILAFIVWIALVFGVFGKESRMSQWIYDDYKKKIDIANKIKERKIVIIGGSNVLFGVDSKLLSKVFKMRVVNFGVNAGIELPLTLYIAKRVLKKGDIAILALEYSMYMYNGKAGVQMIDYLISREANFFWKLSLKEQFYILWHIDLKRVLKGYFEKSLKPMMVGVYGVKNLNEYGDQINTEIKFRDKNRKAELEADLKNYEKLSGDFVKYKSIKWIDEFVRWCKKRGIKVVFMPPSIAKNKKFIKESRDFFKKLNSVMKEKSWEFVGNPTEYMFDKDCFFNTRYHLIDRCRRVRTELMIRDLKVLNFNLN